MDTLTALKRELAKYSNLDPKAVMSIAAHEGLSGGIGDNGTSFGPFQLHWGGAYPSFAPSESSQAANAWAWSPQGIDYALNRISSVAGGLHGLPAISAISRRFERPANPAAEIADAARHYGIRVPGNVAQVPQGGQLGAPTQTLGALPPNSAPNNAGLILSLVHSILSNNASRIKPITFQPPIQSGA